jgi:hypothetical protein
MEDLIFTYVGKEHHSQGHHDKGEGDVHTEAAVTGAWRI